MSINIPGSGIWVPGQQLLDNGDFIHPVNQRMQTVCTGGFFIDRWFVSHGRATLTPDGIALEKTDVDCFMCETIEAERIPKDNPVVTASIKVSSMSNGALYKIRFIVWDKSGGALDINGELATSPGVIFFTVDLSPYKNFEMLEVRLMNSSDDLGKSVTFSAAKLEPGPVSTLMYDAPPNYQQELAKCQRYFVKMPENFAIFAAQNGNQTNTTMHIDFPAPMRTTPTITIACSDTTLSPSYVTPLGFNVQGPTGTGWFINNYTADAEIH